MGALPGLFGLAGGANGTGFSGPMGAPLVQGVTGAEANTAYNQNQAAMQGQQALLNALQGQNGLGNQSNVFNQLQGIASGTGPNPAKAQLAQSTAANTANQAALMAGQRGANSNVGLMARQAAQQGAATQQQAAGQAATMQAQQSLAALGQAGNMANTMAGQQIGQVNQNQQAAQNSQANILNGLAGINSTAASMQSNVNNVNGQLANTQMQGQQGMIGNMMNSAGSMMGGMMGAEGGQVQVNTAPAVDAATPSFGSDSAAAALAAGPQGQGKQQGGKGPQSAFGKFLQGGALSQSETPQSTVGSTSLGAASWTGQDMSSGQGALLAALGGGVHDYRGGGSVVAANKAEQAVVKGNSYANDRIPAVLSDQEFVLNRKVMQSANPAQAAYNEVAAHLAKKGR